MGVSKGERFATEDIFVDYPFEEVTYRWDHMSQQVFVRFYGEQESRDPISHENNLFNESLRHGEEITREEYERGRVSGHIYVNGNRVLIPHPVSEALEYKNLIVVRIDPPAGVIFNRNIYGITNVGEILWQIQESPHGTQEDKPYTNIFLDPNGVLIAENWNGVGYSVNPESGEISVATFNK
ncbi:hypothetical protein ACIPL1_19660 [Pseudomonas sp. NPDC090202]|uniref:hypothetical protein n=1 Tax=unclassified Pseudomonas TaxID=196821 RepID=UPI0037FCA1DA